MIPLLRKQLEVQGVGRERVLRGLSVFPLNFGHRARSSTALTQRTEGLSGQEPIVS